MAERPNGGLKDPIWLGIRTNLTGEVFQRVALDDLPFLTEYSHGDGFGGLTDSQIAVYQAILHAEIRRLDAMRKGVKQAREGQIPIHHVGQG